MRPAQRKGGAEVGPDPSSILNCRWEILTVTPDCSSTTTNVSRHSTSPSPLTHITFTVPRQLTAKTSSKL
ncbi:hypothetical protein SUGI_0191090 [Cryptomeria japonica]|nr:hypothetical protein SUGI_0191090 [Cryptomeria japonica]